MSFLDDLQLSEKSSIDFNSVVEIQVRNLIDQNVILPVTLPTTDNENKIIQIWKYRKQFFASILDSFRNLRIIPESQIYNGLQSAESGSNLLNRIDRLEPKKWSFVLTSSLRLIVWPYLEAAGKGNHGKLQSSKDVKVFSYHVPKPDASWYMRFRLDRPVNIPHLWDEKPALPSDWVPPKISEQPHHRVHIFRKQEGHLLEDTPCNAARLESVCSQRENFIGYDSKTRKQHFVRVNSDGTMDWAHVHGGIIVDAGSNPFGEWARWNSVIGQEEKWYLKNTADRRILPILRRFRALQQGKASAGPGGGQPGVADDRLGIKAMRDRLLCKESKLIGMHRFRQILQQTNLVDSYNAANPNKQMGSRGVRSETIGGVACSTAYMQGIFDGLADLFEYDHSFVFPTSPDGTLPFTNQQLGQVLRELAIGIFQHGTVPFFSLHFRDEGTDLFPVIHPVYQQTLVGRVIGMLDYIMKGYVNGGIYTEKFIDDWHKNPKWDRSDFAIEENLILFERYCKENMPADKEHYASIGGLIDLLNDNLNLPEELKSKRGFRNSFRIIAKQKSIQKEGNVFVVDADFDVFYDIQPSPEYQQALDIYKAKHGAVPPAYEAMKQAYQHMSDRIHDHMTKMPMCKTYFALLNVISFFSGYFSTLKKHHRIPLFTQPNAMQKVACPPLFPHLPVRKISRGAFKIDLGAYLNAVHSHHSLLIDYLNEKADHFIDTGEINGHSSKEETLKDALRTSMLEFILKELQPAERRHFRKKLEKSRCETEIQSLLHLIWAHYKTVIVENKFSNFFVEKERIFVLLRTKKLQSRQTIPRFLQRLQSLHVKMPLSEFEESIDFLPNELDVLLQRKIAQVAGGCGLRLTPLKAESSVQTKSLVEENLRIFTQVLPETLTIIENSEGVAKCFFRLCNEDISPELEGDFSFLEETSSDSAAESSADFLREDILDFMQTNNEAEFNRFIDVIEDVTVMVDAKGKSLLHHAAAMQNPIFVKKLLERGVNSQAKDNEGYIPLHYAAMSGVIKNCEALINVDSIKIAANNGSTAISLAVEYEQLEVILLLQRCGARLGLLMSGYSILHSALHEGNLKIIKAIMRFPDVKKFVNTCPHEGDLPLSLACELDDLDLIKDLLQLGANPSQPNARGMSPMQLVIEREILDVLDMFLTTTAIPIKGLEHIAKKGSLKMAKKLIDALYGFCTEIGDNALHLSLKGGNIHVAHKLMASCVNEGFLTHENSVGETPLKIAISLKLWDVIEVFYKKGLITDPLQLLAAGYHPFLREIFANIKLTPTEYQRGALLAAQQGNYESLTHIFIPKDVDLAAIQGEYGWRLIHYLAKYDAIYLFRKLLQSNEQLFEPLPEDGGKTLPVIAIEWGSTRIIKVILQIIKAERRSLEAISQGKHLLELMLENYVEDLFFQFFDINEFIHTPLNASGSLAIHVAAKKGSIATVEKLVKAGADINAVDALGMTALDYSVRGQFPPNIQKLLDCNARITLKSLVIAAMKNNHEIVKTLLSVRGADQLLNQAIIETIKGHDLNGFILLSAFQNSFDYVDAEGWTAPLWACKTAQHQILKRMLRLNGKSIIRSQGDRLFAETLKNADGVSANLLLQYGFRGIIDEKTQLNCDLSERFMKIFEPINIRSIIELLKSPLGNTVTTFLPKTAPYRGTPFHSILKHMPTFVVELLFSELKTMTLNMRVVDEAGDTLGHLIWGKDSWEEIYDSIDFSAKNYKGVTPVHCAALKASKEIFQTVVDHLRRIQRLDLLDCEDSTGQTPLFYAVVNNQVDNIAILAKEQADMRHLNHAGQSLLLLAAKRNLLGTMVSLIQLGADPNQLIGGKEAMLLYCAIKEKNIDYLYTLLANGARVQEKRETDHSLIHYAAKTGFYEAIMLLYTMKIPLCLMTSEKFEPVHLAAIHEKLDCLEKILELQAISIDTPFVPNEGEDKWFNQATLLHFAAGSGASKIAKKLMDQGANATLRTENGLSAFAISANTKSFGAFLELFDTYRFIEYPAELRQAIMMAIKADNVDAIKQISRRGIFQTDNIIDGFPGLHLACMVGAVQSVAWYLSQAIDPLSCARNRKNSVEIALEKGHAQIVNMLLKTGRVNLDFEDLQGESYAHRAVRNKTIDCLAVLISHGADITKKNQYEQTPLHLAVRESSHEVVELLLIFSLSMWERDQLGKCPQDYLDPSNLMMKEVFEKFTSIFDQYIAGETPLHIAIKAKSLPAVRLICNSENFKEYNVSDVEGNTPLFLATQCGSVEILKTLEKAI